MRKLLTVLFLGCAMTSFAQDDEETTDLKAINDKKHEFRIDALEGLIVPALDIQYEYVISKYSGAGISTFINLDSDFDDVRKFSISPYYRQYFFNKKDYGARGFFVEGLLQYASGEATTDFLVINDDVVQANTEDWSRFGIGVALGQKWVSRNGFVVELLIGGGRYFGDDEANVPEGFFRGGVNLGYRF